MPRPTGKKKRFAEEYIIDLNATKAAQRAGYSLKTAYSIGQRTLGEPDVQEYVRHLQEERSYRTEITADRVLTALGLVGFGDIRQFFEDGKLRRIEELPEEVASMLSGFDVSTTNRGEGEVEYIAKIKTNDRLKALELMGRHLGMFTDNMHVDLTAQITKIEREIIDPTPD